MKKLFLTILAVLCIFCFVACGGNTDTDTDTNTDTDRLLDGIWVRWGRDVTHWMPLPEPPKEV